MIVAAPRKGPFALRQSFILRFERLCLSLEKNLDSICSPHRDAGAEEIRIFGPHCTCQSECCGEYWPITFVSTAQSLSGFAFKDGVKFGSNRLDVVSQVFERCRKAGVGLAPFFQEGRQVFLGVIEGNVRCEEADTLTRLGVDELPNASPQNGANKDVRVENDHFSGMPPSRGDAVP
jgi:hypothetical protein